MSWVELLTNAEPIRSVFGNIEPELTDVQMHEMLLHHDGPSATLRFDLAAFPRPSPPKWKHFNTVQLTLALDVISHVAVQGWGTSNVGTIEVKRAEGDQITCSFASRATTIVVQFAFLRIAKVSAYLDSARK